MRRQDGFSIEPVPGGVRYVLQDHGRAFTLGLSAQAVEALGSEGAWWEAAAYLCGEWIRDGGVSR